MLTVALASAMVPLGATVALAQGTPPQATLSSLVATSDSSIQVSGSVDPNDSPTTYVVDYGTSPSFGRSSPSEGPVSQQSPVVTALNGLSEGTVYYVRIAATNSSGTSYSATMSTRTQGTFSSGQTSPAPAKDELVARALPGTGVLVGVFCASSSFCMAVGGGGRFFERWNGRSWRRSDAQRGAIWLAVSCLSESFCLAVGTDPGTRVIGARWNGRSWSGVGAFSPAPSVPERGANPGEGLQSLSCATRRDCWAVGYDYGKTLVERWNGRSWSRSSAPVRDGNLISISCSSASDCWTVSTPLNGAPIAPLHFNGHAWQVAGFPSAFTQRRYQDQVVSCRTLAACWVAGSSSVTGSQPTALRRTDNSWQAVSMPAPARSNVVLQGLDCGSSSDCWTVGSASVGAGVVKPSPLAEEWNGSAWHIATITGPARFKPLLSISCPSASFCMAVGAGAFAVMRPAH